MRMQRTEQLATTTAMSPQQFAVEYTEYYQRENSDSPEAARRQLIVRLIEQITIKLATLENVTILDLGAGKQQLERELQQTPNFHDIADRVKIVTLDIAKFTGRKSLLATEIHHVEANGAELPFAAHSFDIVFSNMAIDFMPREETFAEVKRTLKPDGALLINFHHPNLQRKALLRQNAARIEERTVKQKLRFIPADSKNREKFLARQSAINMEQHEIDFILNIFPTLIFFSAEEISHFLGEIFPSARRIVNEQNVNASENGWYAAIINLLEGK